VGQHISESARYAARLARRPLLWLLLAALGLIPIASFIALGYYARAATVSASDLPPLRPLGRAFVLGVKVFAVLLVYGFIIFFAAMYAFVAVVQAAQSMSPDERLLAAFAALFGTAALLALALGVPVALPAAARYGAAKALNPAHNWRIIRAVGLAEYLAFSAATALFSATELLLYVAAVLAGLPSLVATLVVLILAAPLVYLMLWKWAGLILDAAEQRTGAPGNPTSGFIRAFKLAVVRGVAV